MKKFAIAILLAIFVASSSIAQRAFLFEKYGLATVSVEGGINLEHVVHQRGIATFSADGHRFGLFFDDGSGWTGLSFSMQTATIDQAVVHVEEITDLWYWTEDESDKKRDDSFTHIIIRASTKREYEETGRRVNSIRMLNDQTDRMIVFMVADEEFVPLD